MNFFEKQFLINNLCSTAETNDMNTKLWLLAVAAINATYAGQSIAGSDFIVERYTNQSPVPLTEQSDLLSVVVEVDFPASIATVGDAIRYLLQQSGYTLLPENKPAVLEMLDMPLPRVHRRIGPIMLRAAVETIAGHPWSVIEDPVSRTIKFELKPQYASGQPKYQNSPKLTNYPNDAVTAKTARQGTVHRKWRMNASLTLYENLEIWTRQEGWMLDWKSRHDYEISYQSEFTGTLKDVVAQALSFYSAAPVPLTAKFYDGNSVLVVESYQPRN